MNYLSLDIGGSGMKYAVIDDEFHLISKGIQNRDINNQQDFIEAIKDVYKENKQPAGGIAISYCGELDEQTGVIYNGGSYGFNTGTHLKSVLEECLRVRVSIENDGNCAALAELRHGCLQNYEDAFVAVLGTGLAGSIILNRKIRHGVNKCAGALSFMTSDIQEPFSVNNMLAKNVGYRFLIEEYNRLSTRALRNGKEYFELVNKNDELALSILKHYCCHLANTLFNIHLVLDLECFAIGGGISVQLVLQEMLFSEFDRIFQTTPINIMDIKKPQLLICQFHNDANIIGALCHHLECEKNEGVEKNEFS